MPEHAADLGTWVGPDMSQRQTDEPDQAPAVGGSPQAAQVGRPGRSCGTVSRIRGGELAGDPGGSRACRPLLVRESRAWARPSSRRPRPWCSSGPWSPGSWIRAPSRATCSGSLMPCPDSPSRRSLEHSHGADRTRTTPSNIRNRRCICKTGSPLRSSSVPDPCGGDSTGTESPIRPVGPDRRFSSRPRERTLAMAASC